jgi:hypothetical protein
MKGIGRVTFMAHLAEITAELDAGRPLKATYENRQGRLGISYRQFARYVDQLIRRGGRGQAPSPPPAAAPPPRLAYLEPDVAVGITATEQAIDAAHHTPRTFNHDPVERPDDRRRLLGED